MNKNNSQGENTEATIEKDGFEKKETSDFFVEKIADTLSLPIVSNKKWIFLEINEWINYKSIFNILKKVLNSGYYIVWLEYQTILNIFLSDKYEEDKIKLWKEIHKFNQNEFAEYYKKISEEGDCIYFDFWEEIMDRSEHRYNNKDISKKEELNKDKILATLIRQWIIYWIDTATIQENIEKKDNNNPKKIIAQWITPVHWKDAEIKKIKEIKRNFAPIIDKKNQKADMKRYKCSIPQISDLTNPYIIHKTPPTKWKDWINIYWKIIAHKTWKDIDIKKFAWPWTKIEHTDSGEYLAAEQRWFIVRLPSGKIWISPKPVNHENIWPQTWIIQTDLEDFVQIWTIYDWYWIEWKNIFLKSWELEWFIYSQWGEININDNVIWWEIKNDNWNIKISWKVHSRSYIQAIHGKIILNNVENSVIIWEDIQIKSATNCNIIGKKISVENCISSKLFWLDINIWKLKSWNQKTNAMIPIIESNNLKKRIQSLDEYSRQISQEIDQAKIELKSMFWKNELDKLCQFQKKIECWDISEWDLDYNKRNRLRKIKKLISNEIQPRQQKIEKLEEQYEQIIQDINNLKNFLDEWIKTNKETINFKLSELQDSYIELNACFVNELFLEDNDTQKINNSIDLSKWLQTEEVGKKEIWKINKPCNVWYDVMEIKISDKIKSEFWHFWSQRIYHRLDLIPAKSDILKLINSKHETWNKLIIPVKIDNLWEWIVFDIWYAWLWVYIKNEREKPVVLKKWDKINVEWSSLWVSFKTDIVISWITKEKNYTSMWGFFIWLSWPKQRKIIRLKNRLEVIKTKWKDPEEED